MRDERFEVTVTFDAQRGYVACAPELRHPIVALSLASLRKPASRSLMMPDDVHVVLQLDGLAERERHRRRPQPQLAASRALGTCIHTIAIGDSDLIKVRFAPLWNSSRTSWEVREVPEAAVSNRSKGSTLIRSPRRRARATCRGTSKPSALAVFRLRTSSNLVGLHDRQVGGLLALEDSPGIYARLAIGIGNAGSVAHQPADRDVFAQGIDRRDGMTCGERDDGLAMRVGQRAGADEQLHLPGVAANVANAASISRAAGRVGNDELQSKCLRRFRYIGSLDLGLRPRSA